MNQLNTRTHILRFDRTFFDLVICIKNSYECCEIFRFRFHNEHDTKEFVKSTWSIERLGGEPARQSQPCKTSTFLFDLGYVHR